MTTLTLPDQQAVRAIAAPAPGWFASVMGTGILATAALSLPVHLPFGRALAWGAWPVAATLLAVLTVHVGAHLLQTGRHCLDDPAAAQFWGAPPMAIMTVGGGALLLGVPGALPIAAVCWLLGTALGLAVAVVVPYRTLTRGWALRHAGWLMPVVPPMVSAANGALLAARLPQGTVREHVLGASAAMFGASLIAALVVISQLWARLAAHGPGEAATVPTLWIVLGPLGQSMTAVHLLAGAAPERYHVAAGAVAVLYAVPVLGFALLWLSIAAAVTVRTARAGLPFSPAWWAFTFPVGTLVTGVAGLASRTGSPLLAGLGVVLFGLLLGGWGLAATGTTKWLCNR